MKRLFTKYRNSMLKIAYFSGKRQTSRENNSRILWIECKIFKVLFLYEPEHTVKFLFHPLLNMPQHKFAVTAKLNVRKDFILRSSVCDIIRPSKELHVHSK